MNAFHSARNGFDYRAHFFKTSTSRSREWEDFPAFDAGFFLVLVVHLEFLSAAFGAVVLHPLVEAFPGGFRVPENPLSTPVENHGFSLHRRACGLCFLFKNAYFLAVTTRAGIPVFKRKTAVFAGFHKYFLLEGVNKSRLNE